MEYKGRQLKMSKHILFALVSCFVTLVSAWPVNAQQRAPFAEWRAALWADAEAFGITRATFDKALSGVVPNYRLPDLVLKRRKGRVKGQAEFTRPPQAYVREKTIARLAARGRALLIKHDALLRRIERELGVSRFALLALWGRETAFGGYRLRNDAIRALATQAYAGRRAEMFRRELLFALKMLQDGVVTHVRNSSRRGRAHLA